MPMLPVAEYHRGHEGNHPPPEARAYLDRWKLVEEIELIELRRNSMAVKLGQLSALMASRGLFGADPGRENGVQLVRERWACLRMALRG